MVSSARHFQDWAILPMASSRLKPLIVRGDASSSGVCFVLVSISS